MTNYGTAASDLATRRLRPYADGLVADDLTADLDLAAREIRQQFPCIGAYGMLSTSDAVWFDQAVGMLASINLLASVAAEETDGMESIKVGSFSFKAATVDAAERAKWGKDLQTAISYITCVAGARQAIAAGLNIFEVAGTTRTREAAGRYSLPRLIASLLPSGWGGDRPARGLWNNRDFV